MIEGPTPYELPITVGRDFSGTVAALGAAVTGIVTAMPNIEARDALGAVVADSSLRVPIIKTCSLDQISQALKDFTSGTIGKIAVAVY